MARSLGRRRYTERTLYDNMMTDDNNYTYTHTHTHTNKHTNKYTLVAFSKLKKEATWYIIVQFVLLLYYFAFFSSCIYIFGSV